MTIEDIILGSDGRGISALRPHLPANFCADAAGFVLGHPGTALIATGFYILSGDAVETDGPPGALAIGRALEAMGQRVAYVTDARGVGVLRAIAGLDADVVEFPTLDREASEREAQALMDAYAPSLLVGIERCAPSADGAYRNMRGVDIGANTAQIDALFDLPGVASVGIGDGGNEIGMGNLAAEIAQKQLTATVIASDDPVTRAYVQAALGCSYFRVYAGNDRYGAELGGSLKNIYAIAAGMAAALGMGENTRSMLMTRALAEMSRFAVALGANPMTFLGLSGVGDLIVTCSSELSRNYRVGYALGQGHDLDSAIEVLGQVAEGVNTVKLVCEKARQEDIYMPLAQGLYRVMFDGIPAKDMAKALMESEQSSDVEFMLSRESVSRAHELAPDPE